MKRVTRLIPEPSVSRDDFSETASQQGWIFHDLIAPSEDAPFEKIWLTQDQQTGIHWIEDDMIGLPYILLEGADQEAVASEVRGAVETYDQDELLAMVKDAEDVDEEIQAVYRLAAGAPQTCEEELLEVFRELLAHEHPHVRRAAIVSTVYPAWTELIAPLENLSENDPDPDVRSTAANVLLDLREESWARNAAP